LRVSPANSWKELKNVGRSKETSTHFWRFTSAYW
jgi:hypothetical protein